MRNRILRPGFFKNETLAELPPLTRILFQGLWLIADREGLVEDRPKRIKAEILPYDEIDVSTALDELESSGFVSRIICQDGVKVIRVSKFKKYQKIHHKEAESIFKTPTLPPTDPQLAPNQPPTDRSSSTSTCASTFSAASALDDGQPPKIPETTKSDGPEIKKLTQLFIDLRLDNDPGARIPGILIPWESLIGKIHFTDNRSYSQIREVIQFSQTDEFWRSNILEPRELRQKFQKLVLGMKRGTGKKTVTDKNKEFLRDYLGDKGEIHERKA